MPSLRYLHGVPQFKEQYHFLDGDVGPIGGFTWDGRAASLQDQAMIPLLAANEMANASPADVAQEAAEGGVRGAIPRRIRCGYFQGSRSGHSRRPCAPLEAFQQVPEEFFPYQQPVRCVPARERSSSPNRKSAACNCSRIPPRAIARAVISGFSRAGTPPPFTDFDFVNVGVPRNPRIAANADPNYYDLGLCGPARQDLAGKREYCGFFRSPTVRNSAIRDAFFHNGVFYLPAPSAALL